MLQGCHETPQCLEQCSVGWCLSPAGITALWEAAGLGALLVVPVGRVLPLCPHLCGVAQKEVPCPSSAVVSPTCALTMWATSCPRPGFGGTVQKNAPL